MKREIVIASLLLLFPLISYTQKEEDINPRKIKFYLTSGLGISYFHYDVRNLNQKINGRTHAFAAPNFRIGLTVDKPILINLYLRAGLRFGVRIKRDPLYEDFRITGIVYPYTFFYLDERVSGSNAYFVEIPIGLQYAKGRVKIGVEAVYRDFAVFADANDPIEFGILPSISYAMTSKANICLEYYIGFREVIRDVLHDDFGRDIYYTATSRFAQVKVEYKLTRKK